LRTENSISYGLASETQIADYCLELSKIDPLKMLDLQKKSAINLDNLQVRLRQQVKHQDRNRPIPYIVVLLRSKIAQAIIPNYIYETLILTSR
jgi:hypothetical protein